jgi:cation:H+ antiporter
MITFLLICAGLVLLYLGAELLVRGAVRTAVCLGVSPLVIGLTVVAYGTSAPELTVSIQAALEHLGDLAAANVVGSNTFNIALILGVSSLICPISVGVQLVRQDVPVMIGVSLLCVLFLWDRRLSRLEGFFLFAGIVLYTAWIFYQAKRRPQPAAIPTSSVLPTGGKKGIWLAIIGCVGGLLFLIAGSKSLIVGSVRMARYFGVSEVIIGLTIVSGGTSLPELATSVLAAIRRQPDIALGNIAGSNIFNILAILGLSSLAVPYAAPGLTGFDLGMMLATAILSLIFLRTRFTLSRLEGGIFLCIYAFYLWRLWPK